MKSLPRLSLAVLLPLLFVALVGCSDSGSNPPPKTLTSISVTPSNPSIQAGTTQQFTATGTYSDSSTANITTQVTWSSATTATATISGGGLATAVAAGTSSITATLGTVTGSTTLTVVSLTSIAVTPSPATVALTGTLQLTATGTYSDATTADLTSQVTWNSSQPTIATVSTTGLATGVALGTTNVTASLGTVTSPIDVLTVGGTSISSIKITPSAPTVAVGAVVDFTAVGVLGDGTEVPLVGPLTWTSGTTANATILSPQGIASGVAAGTSTITVNDADSTLSASTGLTVVPATARMAYVAGVNDLTSATYAVNVAGATLTPVGALHDPEAPTLIVTEPSGRFAYGPGYGGAQTVSIYNVDPVTGALSIPTGVSAPVPPPEGGNSPSYGAVDPTGRFLYITNSGSDNVSAFAIDTVAGGLTPITGSPFAVGSFPTGLAISPNGKYVYVANAGGSEINAFSIGADGSLAALAASASYPVGSAPAFVAFTPDGSTLYVTNSGDNSVSAFSVAADGSLTAVAGSPFTAGVGNAPYGAAVDPKGKYLLVVNDGAGTVSSIAIGAGGALGAATTYPTSGQALADPNSTPVGVSFDPTGTFVAVANSLTNRIAFFTFDSTTGVLTAKGAVETRLDPQFVTFSRGIAVPTISAATVHAANSGSNDISSFTLDPSTGVPTVAASSPTLGLAANSVLAASTSGKYLFTTAPADVLISGFTVDSSTAALTALPGASAAAVGPASLYVEPAGEFVFAANTTGNTVVSYHNDATAGLSPSLITPASVTTINAFVGSPQGIIGFALGSGQIYPVLLGAIDGNMSPVNPLTTPVPPAPGSVTPNWTSGAVSPSGRYLVALDLANKSVRSFGITSITGGGGTDGALTLVNPSGTTSVGGTGPYTATFDPLGRFVYVADFGKGTIRALPYNQLNGQFTAVGTLTTIDPTGISGFAVDATGTYAYITRPGTTSPATPGSVNTYTINPITGALSTVASGAATAGTTTGAVVVTNSVH